MISRVSWLFKAELGAMKDCENKEIHADNRTVESDVNFLSITNRYLKLQVKKQM
jgi:hypothetical protein